MTDCDRYYEEYFKPGNCEHYNRIFWCKVHGKFELICKECKENE